MTRARFIEEAITQLNRAGIEDAGREARRLLTLCLGIEPYDLLKDPTAPLKEAERERLYAWLARRLRHEPLSRIAGAREFWKHSFALNPATLEPRADSETLISAVTESGRVPMRILDIGTGSGCLLISLLYEYPEAQGTGTDISGLALAAARQNAASIGVHRRSNFVETSWCDGITENFDLIISNPPYIRSAEIAGLESEVKDYDPRAALDGGADGLDAYKAILPQAFQRLLPGGTLACEVGYDQAEDVARLFRSHGFTDIILRKDTGGIERVVAGRKP